MILLFACKKSIQSNPVDENVSGTGTGNGTVQGVITDLDNSPVSNATVTGGTATATTDAGGKFTLTKVQFNSDTVVVIGTKDGFFEGAKSFVSGNYPCGFLTTVNRVTYGTEYFSNRPQTSVTEYGPVGGYITGSASGSVFRELSPGVTDGTPLPFTCTYKILRIQ